ncbi:phosphoribosylformylglycinamidine synthase subunit PurL [Helicobacter anseris]|uniref:Phosphoribosylformylglycinamidine synthase subunit PurL n=1 Tax=Helicobacter anseris TaxID=375926 RepID=A0A3D8JAL1_9HELI|nr:phosphoribosylformylglycinamidine synthase subunit PurL [Helicobacter anseris]
MQNLQEILKKHKLTQQEYENIKDILQREPNLLEIGIFSAMWSEHCSYKSSKKYLSGFPTKAPWVIQGPGENAGVIDITGGYSAVFKVESHNHPSFIEPVAGAATGVGGIMRDVFTMGARPVASLDSIRFGRIDRQDDTGKLHRFLLKGVVKGIGGYGNCMGVPTIGGETTFDDCYDGNILVNAFTLGIAKTDEIFYGRAEGIGNPVIYVGSKTGRDGLGGAVMSSDSFDEESKSLRPTVQIGDPFSEKLLLEACLELFKKDLIVGIQDMGAAGLTSSSFEMAGRSGSGMIMHLDKVPMRELGMTPYELMLSESQERMLICAKKGCEKQVLEIFEKWEIDASVIGEVTDTGMMELYWYKERCAYIPIAPITEKAPVLDREIKKPQYLKEVDRDYHPKIDSLKEVFMQMLGSIDIANKSYIYNQYDSMVQANTIVGVGNGDASVIRVKENNTALAMTIFSPITYCYLNPKEGGKIAVACAGRKCVSRGARPLAISDCLNFGNPTNPEVMWQFKEATDGIKEACEKLKTPVVSGNVSLYNQTNDKDIYPTPTIVTVGLNKDVQKVLTSALQKEDSELILFGDLKEDFGGSLIQKLMERKIFGKSPTIDLEKELRLWDLILQANNDNLILSAKAVGKGGIAMALAKMAILGNKGFEVNTGVKPHLLFAESQSLMIVETQNSDLLLKMANKFQISAQILGKVKIDKNIILDSLQLDLDEIGKVYYESFEKCLD